MLRKLKEVIHNIDFEVVLGDIDLELLIYNIQSNSKKIVLNSIFVALDGHKVRGINYLDEAITNGAKICFIPYDCPTSYYENYKDIAILKSNNLQYVLSKLLSNFYGDKIPKHIITLSGTNGKSSVCLFMSQLLSSLKISNMVIGTLGVFINNFKEDSINTHNQLNGNLTTPSAETLWEHLHYAYCHNIEYILMESSSHGISQHRVSNINFDCIGFSNLSQDHLDYHKNMVNYFNSKAYLFLNNNKSLSLINVDDEWGEKLFLLCKQNNLITKSYGYTGEDIKLSNIEVNTDFQCVSIKINNHLYNFKLNLLGEFQVYNVLCAIGLLYYSGINLENLLNCVKDLVEIEGRLNLVKHPSGAKIFIDFAHTPNALQEVLKVLKKDNPFKLKVLFGCGGNRDTTKRSIMGAIASEYCDEIYVSDDNPRYEDPKEIRKQIIDGILSTNKNQIYMEIGDRRDAIELALKNLQANEILLIAGKGHEEGQQIKDEYIEFNDKKIVKQIIERLKC